MKITFLKVLGVSTPLRDGRPTPEIVAFVDACKVTWRPQQGWTCRDCDEPADTCRHVEAVAALIAPSITGETR